MNTRMRLRSAVATLVLSALGSSVWAYELGDPPYRWFTTPQTVTVDQSGMTGVGGDGGVSATVDAINEWNGNGTPSFLPVISIVHAQSGDASGITPGDGFRDVIFSDPFHICSGGCLASTIIMIDETQTGQCGGLDVAKITDMDIVFNTRPAGPGGWTTSDDGDCLLDYFLDVVAKHEAGHLIGLLHSTDSTALMDATAGVCDDTPIGTDDQNGRNALYNCAFAAALCGNGSVTGGEECDPPDSEDACSNVSEYPTGSVTCSADCTWDTSQCTDGARGVSCTLDDQCESQRCKGPAGGKTCK